MADSSTYEEAIETLQGLYSKPRNEVFTRHLLATRKQELGQNLDQYFPTLKNLERECDFKAVAAGQNRNDVVRDVFIAELLSSDIRQRLLEHKSLDLQTT